jgi:hypothetical protein
MKDKDFINQTLTPLCSTKNTRRVANLHQIMKSDKKELLLNCTLLYHIVFCITTPYRINSATPQVNSYILLQSCHFKILEREEQLGLSPEVGLRMGLVHHPLPNNKATHQNETITPPLVNPFSNIR